MTPDQTDMIVRLLDMVVIAGVVLIAAAVLRDE